MVRALRIVAALLVSIILGMPAVSAAQSERGTISGVVTDATKGGLPGATVKVTNIATNQVVDLVTSGTGAYSAANLPPGMYRVEATLTGFRPTAVTNVQVSAGGGSRVDVVLEVGGITDTVNVVANASFLQTEDARVSTNVSNQLIDQLPLVVGGAMRSVFDLVSTVAEAKGTGQTASLGGGQGGGYSASLDGILITTNRGANTAENALLTPSLEAITEFSVETNGFKPEFGQAAGGAITFASKSGTNRFQGSLYEFLRNERLDAKEYFATGAKPIYRQNNFGSSWGGPLKLPGYNGRDKTFFFTTYEGFVNEENQASGLLSVPTLEMLDGDFSNLVDRNGNKLLIYDYDGGGLGASDVITTPGYVGVRSQQGRARVPFPNNRIPADRFSQLAKNYIALVRAAGLAPNQGGTPGTFAYINNNFLSGTGTDLETTHKFSLKFDHQLSSNQRISYLYNLVDNIEKFGKSGPVGIPRPLNGATKDGYDTNAHRFSWDLTGTKMVNRFSFGMNGLVNDGFSSNVGGDWAAKGFCIKNAVDCNKNLGNIGFSEFVGWGSAGDNGTKQPRWTIKNDLSIMAGDHTLKTGVTWDRQEANGFGQQQIAGNANFNYSHTAATNGLTTQTSGSSFASFLLGYASGGGTEQIREVRQTYPYFAFYGQDDWRLTNRLVLNYGLRYEFTLPAREAGGNKYSDFSPTLPNPKVNGYPGAMIFAGFGPGRQNKVSLIEGYYGAIAPRASLAFRMDEKTIFRAGVGRSFGRVTVPGGSSHFDGFIGNWGSQTVDNSTPAFLLDYGLPLFPLPVLDPSISNNANIAWWGGGNQAARPGYYDSWTFSAQRDLHRGLTAEIDYNGSYGKNLPTGLITANQVPLSKVQALIDQPGVGLTGIKALLDTTITASNLASMQARGINLPYPQFLDSTIQSTRTVAQSLRPFPQYGTIALANGGGDKTGKSHYHAVVLKLNQRMRAGLSIQSSYSWSRIYTDSDRFGNGSSLDTARPELEWSIGSLDQTHNIKINTVYELPFGRDRRWLRTGVASGVLGGWRVALSQAYVSGVPLTVTAAGALTIFNTANRPNVVPGQSWLAPTAGKDFDPRVDVFYNRAAFALPVGTLGNAPRTNPDVRRDWSLNENISLAKTFDTAKVDVDVRLEAFNLLNRVYWGAPNSNFSATTFGQVTTQGNTPRQMQIGLKLYW